MVLVVREHLAIHGYFVFYLLINLRWPRVMSAWVTATRKRVLLS